MEHRDVVVIGAGPAGLAAAHELASHGARPLVIEKAGKVGGIARTEEYKGYRFDVGGHRFYTKDEEIDRLWHEMLGEKFLKVKRLSRIYYQGRFFKYPLKFSNALWNLGAAESSLLLMSYVAAKLKPAREEKTFDQWVTNRFGARLYRTFFEGYTEKVWGMPPREIQADWAAQRIGAFSMGAAVRNALFGTNGPRTLASEFNYPVLGPGMMWQRFRERVEEMGGRVALGSEVVGLEHDSGRVTGALVREGRSTREIRGGEFISSMALSDLVKSLSPEPPAVVLEAARNLRYRAFIMAALIMKRRDLFDDNWIYVHSPSAVVARIQNFRNWSAAMVADPQKGSIGMEYFCSEGDRLWNASDEELLGLAAREIGALGLAEPSDVEDGTVIRQPKAYPVYDAAYHANLRILRDYLGTLGNLQTIGRNGLHRYNNQDHSMLGGIRAARNILGEEHDVRSMNPERSPVQEAGSGDRRGGGR